MSDAEVGSQVKAVCTQVCGKISKTSSSCTKTLLVNIRHVDEQERVFRTYAVIDEQNNRFLATSGFFGGKDPEIQYELTLCSEHSNQLEGGQQDSLFPPWMESLVLAYPTDRVWLYSQQPWWDSYTRSRKVVQTHER